MGKYGLAETRASTGTSGELSINMLNTCSQMLTKVFVLKTLFVSLGPVYMFMFPNVLANNPPQKEGIHYYKTGSEYIYIYICVRLYIYNYMYKLKHPLQQEGPPQQEGTHHIQCSCGLSV